MHDFKNIIQDLNLILHPEGGFIKKHIDPTYSSTRLIAKLQEVLIPVFITFFQV